jgi:signal transduction histidine kinase
MACDTVAEVTGSGTDPIARFADLRVLAPVAATVSFVGAIVVEPSTAGHTALAAAAAACFIVWAVRMPASPLALVITSTVLVVASMTGGDLEPALFMLAVAATVAGSLEESRARFAVEAVVLAAAPTVATFVVDDELATATWTAGMMLPLALTRVSRHQELLSKQLADALADQMVTDERRRIARDVHDSVGHGLAAMLLHITGARHVLHRDTASADQALAEAEEIGRRSLLELRRTLGLLRADDASAAASGPAAPVPDGARLASLGIEIVGDTSRLDSLAATSLHRVAEEALANARQHAAGPAQARLVVGDDRAVLTVESSGHALHADGDDRPHYGIVGMSERMAAVGGELAAGPTPTGWLVRASAPIVDPADREAAP